MPFVGQSPYPRWISPRNLCALVLFLGFGISTKALAVSGPAQRLFEPSTSLPLTATPPPFSKRHSFVRLNPSPFSSIRSAFHKPGLKLNFQLNLFDDAQYNLVLDRPEFRGGDRMTLTGHLEGIDQSLFILAYQQGMLDGVVVVPGKGSFQIRYLGNGLHSVTEDDSDHGPRCANQTTPPTPSMAAGFPQEGQPPLIPINYPPGCPYAQSVPVLDILVVYTADAKTDFGGTAAAAQNMIDLAVAYTNRAYFNSGLNVQMRCVHIEETAYSEVSASADLGRVQNPTDGFMDNVPVLRDTYGADLVALVTGPQESGGLAYYSYPDGSTAYSVISSAYLIPGFTHETGHNLGCDHDAANAGTGGAFSYSKGWNFAANGPIYGTVMSYPGIKIPYYSSPLVTYLGVKTGTTGADNARSIQNTAPVEANYRPTSGANAFPSADVTYPAEGSVFSSPLSLTLTASASDSDGTVTQVDFFIDGIYYGSSASSPYLFPWDLVPAGPHYISVHAIDDGGAIQYSCPVSIFVNSSLPPPWVDQDIGTTGVLGSSSYAAGVFTVNGSGDGIGFGVSGPQDSFQYTHHGMCGDGSITARVTEIQSPSTSAQAGVMIMGGLGFSEPNAAVYVTPAGQAVFSWRPVSNFSTTTRYGPALAFPCWVRVSRTGNSYTGYVSTDGAAWTAIGAPVMVTMTANSSLAGLAVSDRSSSTLSSAAFDNVAVSDSCLTPTPSPTRTLTSTLTVTSTLTQTSTRTSTFTRTITLTPTVTNTRTSTPTLTNSRTLTVSPTLTNTRTSTSTPTVTNSRTSTSTATQSFTFTASPTRTSSPTPTITNSPTLTTSPTPTKTPTMTSTPSLTLTSTASGTSTLTATPTLTSTLQFSPTPTSTLSQTPTLTDSPTPTSTSTFSQTLTLTKTSTGTATFTASPTQTSSLTLTATPTLTSTLSSTPTATNTPTQSSTFTSTATGAATSTGTATGTSTFTPTSSSTPSLTRTLTLTPTMTGTSTVTSSATSTATFTATLSASPTSTMTATKTSTSTLTATLAPSLTPTFTSTPTPTPTTQAGSTPILSDNPSNGSPIQVLPQAFAGPSLVTVQIYTVNWKLVQTKDYGTMNVGWVTLELTDGAGQPLAGGLYYVRVTTKAGSASAKLLIIR